MKSVPTLLNNNDVNTSYTDLNALTNLKSQARDDKNKALPEVAKQFESILIGMMIKTMRESSMGDDLFGSSAGDSYQGMHDQQLALELSKGKGFGLADSIVAQLQKEDRTLSGDELATTMAKADGAIFNMPNRKNFYIPVKMKIEEASKTLPLINLKNDEVTSVDLTQNEGKTAEQNDNPVDNKTINKAENKQDTNLNTPLEANLTESTKQVEKTLDISSPENFVKNLLPLAENAAKRIGVNPEVLVAQAALETGWGKSIIKTSVSNSFNLFNIKADSRWDGDKIEKISLEYEKGMAVNKKSAFRAYDSLQQSFDDYANFIQNNPRYDKALKAAADPEQYLHEVHKAGYATDPKYAEKIIRVMNSSNLQDGLKNSVTVKST